MGRHRCQIRLALSQLVMQTRIEEPTLMLPIERKSIQPMALAVEGGDIQAVQQVTVRGRWRDRKLVHRHWQLVDKTLGEEDGVADVDR